jgi:hypothetical protein
MRNDELMPCIFQLLRGHFYNIANHWISTTPALILFRRMMLLDLLLLLLLDAFFLLILLPGSH